MRNKWNTFNNNCNTIEAWYNEQRQYISPTVLDQGCTAIRVACAGDRKAALYVGRNETQSRGKLSTLSASTIIQNKRDSVGHLRRDAFNAFDASTFVKSHRAKAVQAGVLKWLQEEFNEQLRLESHRHNIFAGDVSDPSDLSLTSVHHVLKDRGITSQADLTAGLFWHREGDAMIVTDSPHSNGPGQFSSLSLGGNTTIGGVDHGHGVKIKTEEGAKIKEERAEDGELDGFDIS